MRDARVFGIVAIGLVASATFMLAPALFDRFPSIVTGPAAAVPAGPTRVLILATFHLRHIKDWFDPAYLDSVIERLATFRPAAIAVESMAGDLIASIGREKETAQSPLLKAVTDSPVYIDDNKRLEDAITGRNLLPAFRTLNSAEHAVADVDAQWGVFLTTGMPGGEDRGRLALWENRNLKIAARIQAVCSAYHGRNVLVICGAAHKPFLESYLGRMMNTEIVRFDDLTSP